MMGRGGMAAMQTQSNSATQFMKRLAHARTSANGAAVPVHMNAFFTQDPMEKSDLMQMYAVDEPEYQEQLQKMRSISLSQ